MISKIEKALRDLHHAQIALTAVLVDDDVIEHTQIERMGAENLKNARMIADVYGLMNHQKSA